MMVFFLPVMPALKSCLPALTNNRFKKHNRIPKLHHILNEEAMKTFYLVVFIIATFFVHKQTQNSRDAVLGKWTNENKTRVVEFVNTGISYNAIIRKAPDESIVGKNQITDIIYSNGIYNGKVNFPKKGKSYPCRLRIKNDGSIELTVKVGFINKSQIWTRIK